MAKLILSLDGMVLREYPLTKERTTIGRKPHNDIVIDNLAVSGEHAMIMTILNDSFLEDLGSTNGTLVNGQAIKKHFLQNNDVVELGKYKLKYVTEVVAAAAPPDFEKTMILRAPAGGAKPPGPAPAAAAAPAAPPAPAVAAATATEPDMSQSLPKNFGDTVVNPEMMQSQGNASLREAARQATASAPGGPATAVPAAAPVTPKPAPVAAGPAGVGIPPAPQAPVPGPAAAAAAAAVASQPVAPGMGGLALGTIQILSGPSAGKELPLSKPLTTLGKPGVQVAVIAKRPQGYFITHVEGPTYPVVNGKQLDAQAHALSDHDVIELAGVKMEFFLKPA
jgi:pSer/pThr/pTyr-binding forkhead associated (FHA) protein